MLDILNRYAHGFVVVPVVLASRRGGLISHLESSPTTFDRIVSDLGANSGHLRVVLRLFESLGWIECDRDNITATDSLTRQALIPDDLWDLLDRDMDDYLHNGRAAELGEYLLRSKRRWDIDDELMADFIDGLLVVPMLSLPAKYDELDELLLAESTVFSKPVLGEIQTCLQQLNWATSNGNGIDLTGPGEFMIERSMNLGVAESYRAMLLSLDEILFGDATRIFGQDDNGDEMHVDRNLNVIASGFMHDRFFAEVEEIIVSIFDRKPFDSQPRYVADMGSGDGTFLRRIYETVRDKTERGKVLNEFPLTMIGIDLNQASLDETSKTLGTIDHITVTGDIGVPADVQTSLEKLGVESSEVLHIRSFLDHDRPYIPPEDKDALVHRESASYLGAYVDRAGREVKPHEAVQSLVEHLDRWADLVNDHGFILLEVHCQDPLVVRQYIDQSESLYFDAIEGFSHQLLIEADVALMAAAEAGLFPRRDYFRKYPGVLPYCRITLNLFERRPYRVRMARPGDIQQLHELERACWPDELRTSDAEILRRIEDNATGQWVVEMDDKVVGVVYSQRIANVECLQNVTLDGVPGLQDKNGPVVQLLGLNVLPEVQSLGLGDQLLDLILMRSALQGGVSKVAGITRCLEFGGRNKDEFDRYVAERTPDGRPSDPVMQFHHEHGATFIAAVHDYRPKDSQNVGAGVLLCYDFSGPGTDISNSQQDSVDGGGEMSARELLEHALLTVLGETKRANFSWSRSFKDIGVDSLGLLELRTLIQQKFGCVLSPTFFFSHPNLQDILAYFESDEQQMQASETETALSLDIDESVSPARSVAASPQVQGGDIAIVGAAGRFPGAENLDEFWSLLESGGDAITEVPPSRWNIDEYYSEDFDAPGRMVCRHGGFLGDIDQFDASFFGISPSEARLMDPQQRLLMEIHWNALEDAGIDPASLRDAQCGIFVGLYSHDYEILQVESGSEADLGAYYATGVSASIAAGRLAYFLGTRGPALTIDTACSSSLVAVHEAMQSLRSGQTDVAIASGASLILSPRLSIIFSKAGMLSPDGRCKTFDSSANGYVRSEGCGAVVLKRLADAQRDGDKVLAVLKGSCINQDGASNGLTAPNMNAQEALLRGALKDAKLQPGDIGAIETHGTGTNLGDPVEVAAINRVFSKDSERTAPLWLGTVKTNIGHCEAAAGIAGLLKTVLAMRNASLPKHLHLEQANPLLEIDSIPARIPQQTSVWADERGEPLRAGVSSFGFSGTNAHVIVEQAPASSGARPASGVGQGLLALSAKSDTALDALIGRYLEWLPDYADADLRDISATVNAGRARLDRHCAVSAGSIDELCQALRQKRDRKNYASSPTSRPKIAFLFTGQGAQHLGMARSLAETNPVFRDALRRCQEILEPDLDCPLTELVYPAGKLSDADLSKRLDDTANTQPALFAIEYALARTLQSWGIEADVVLGHSVGEYVAACIAGIMSLEDAVRLIAARGRLMGSLPAGGGMLNVAGSRDTLLGLLPDFPGLEIAAYNSPLNTVVAGPAGDLDGLLPKIEAAGLLGTRLQVSHAFHSAQMDAIIPAFSEVARWVKFSPPSCEIISNVFGKFAGNEMLETQYWVDHIRRPVRFEQSVNAMLEKGIDLVIEVGPHPVLTYLGQASAEAVTGDVDSSAVRWTNALYRGESADKTIAEMMVHVSEAGVDVDWRAFHGSGAYQRLPAPQYPWQRKSFWFDDRFAGGIRADLSDCLVTPQWIAHSHLHCESLRSVGAVKAIDVAAPGTALDKVRAGVDAEASLTRLNQYCASLVRKALQDIGVQFSVGDSMSVAGLEANFGIDTRHRRLLHRLLQILEEEGMLASSDSGFTVREGQLPFTEISAPDDALLQAGIDAELSLLRRCGEQLGNVLVGKVDPLELIFPDGSLHDAVEVYTNSAFAGLGNAVAESTVQEIVASLDEGQTLRILELGAGTGGTTKGLLPLLPADRTEYVFSDLSELFLNRAAEKFADFPFVRYQLLDIEQPAVRQGLADAQFDLVIASNVIHATRDLGESLGHVCDLLAPGGRLLFVEGTRKTRWVDLVFGLTEGWWRFDDIQLRPDYPLLSATQWQSLLASQGLVNVATVETRGATPQMVAGDVFPQALVLGQKTDVGSPQSRIDAQPDRSDEAWLILTHGHELGLSVANEFAKTNANCRLVDVSAGGASLVDALRDFAAANSDRSVHAVCMTNLVDSSHPKAQAGELDRVAGASHSWIETILASSSSGISSLTFATVGARRLLDDSTVDFSQAALTGLGNVAWAEYQHLNIRQVDLDPLSDLSVNAKCLVQELSSPAEKYRIAFRSGQRFVQQWAQTTPTGEEFQCTPDGIQLIVGGIGDLGMYTAGFLVERGARHIVLAGRSVFPDEDRWDALLDDAVYGDKIRIVRQMRAAGATVQFEILDISDADQVLGLVSRLSDIAPIDVLVQAAAVISDQLLADATTDEITRVFSPKISGTTNLLDAISDSPPKHVLLYSSIGSVVGLPGQASYAAANAYMDAIAAQYRRKLNIQSINWCGWEGTGLAKTEGGRRAIEELALLGIDSLGTADAVRLIGRALESAQAQVAAIPLVLDGRFDSSAIDPDLIELRNTVERRKKYSGIAVDAKSAAVVRPAVGRSFSASEVEETVLESLAKLLDVDQSVIQTDKSLGDLGVDSLLGLEFRKLMQSSFGIVLSATLVWNYPTIKAVVRHIAEVVGVEPSDGEFDASSDLATAKVVDDTEVDSLSDEEALRQLVGDS